jgi:hypothetical protein
MPPCSAHFRWDRVSQGPGWPGNVILPISASHVAWDDRHAPCSQLLVEIRVSLTSFKKWLGLSHSTSNLSLPSS